MAATVRNDDPNRVYCLVQCFVCVVLLLPAVYYIGLACVLEIPHRRYHISIDSASGLDLPAPSQDLALDPQFNLTFRLASSSLGRRACVDAGTYVVVSYRCVPLAASGPARQGLCVGPWKSASMPIFAEGTGVRLPGYVMDGLAADLRNGVEAFEVTFNKLSGGSTRDVVASCGVMRVGDVPAECGRGHTCRDQTTVISSAPVVITAA
jgi:hypothetical protein